MRHVRLLFVSLGLLVLLLTGCPQPTKSVVADPTFSPPDGSALNWEA